MSSSPFPQAKVSGNSAWPPPPFLKFFISFIYSITMQGSYQFSCFSALVPSHIALALLTAWWYWAFFLMLQELIFFLLQAWVQEPQGLLVWLAINLLCWKLIKTNEFPINIYKTCLHLILLSKFRSAFFVRLTPLQVQYFLLILWASLYQKQSLE